MVHLLDRRLIFLIVSVCVLKNSYSLNFPIDENFFSFINNKKELIICGKVKNSHVDSLKDKEYYYLYIGISKDSQLVSAPLLYKIDKRFIITDCVIDDDDNVYIALDINHTQGFKSSCLVLKIDSTNKVSWLLRRSFGSGGLCLDGNNVLFSYTQLLSPYKLGVLSINKGSGEVLKDLVYSKSPQKGGAALGYYDFKINPLPEKIFYFFNYYYLKDNLGTDLQNSSYPVNFNNDPKGIQQICYLDSNLNISKTKFIDSSGINYDLKLDDNRVFYLTNKTGNTEADEMKLNVYLNVLTKDSRHEKIMLFTVGIGQYKVKYDVHGDIVIFYCLINKKLKIYSLDLSLKKKQIISVKTIEKIDDYSMCYNNKNQFEGILARYSNSKFNLIKK